MTLPGITVISRDTPPPRSAPTDTGVWFAAGLAEKGDHTAPTLIRSLAEFERYYGDRVSYGYLYDAADVFFREGGNMMYLSRVVGPAAEYASVNLNDSVPAATLKVKALSVGEWGNSLNVAVSAGVAVGSFVLTITHDTLGTLEISPDLADTAEAITWAESSEYVRCEELAGTGDPAVVAATSLTGGADDRSNITDTHWANALALFLPDLGPGQVSSPGRTSATGHSQLLSHAESNNRRALLDLADTDTVATLVAAAATDRALSTARFGAAFAPWTINPGVVPNTTRTVPYSATQAGLIARSEAAGNTPNIAAAGSNGISRYAIGLSQSWDDSDRESLNDAGVNVARVINNQIKTYGYRTLINPLSDRTWLQFTHSRLDMAIKARAGVIAEEFVFAQIDGRGLKLGEFNSELAGMLNEFWVAGALYGNSPSEAFLVDTGPSVNTPTTIEDGEIHAALAVRMSPFGEKVIIEVAKVPTTEALS